MQKNIETLIEIATKEDQDVLSVSLGLEISDRINTYELEYSLLNS